jgi:uncharacterized protein (TIGR00299 family) protein
MRIAYIDAVGGASGDMLLGSLVDAGAREDAVHAAVAALNLPGCDVRFERVVKGGLSAVQAVVTTPGREAHRHASDLVTLLASADLPPALKARAEAVIWRLARVESNIHAQAVETVHLHELGGDDTLIDIVGVLAGLDNLNVEEVVVSPLPLARGWINSAHGPLPLPAPATLALLTDVPVRYVDLEAELVTPTGAALLTAIARRYGGFPDMILKRVGCGAGRRDLPIPNVVRLWLGEAGVPPEGLTVESLAVLETNVDDMNPQIYAHVMDRLFAAGALDVTLAPVQMKKNRPATLLWVLARPAKADELIQILFEETTTLGVRRQAVDRVSLPRTMDTVQTAYGPIRVKVAHLASGTRCMPEYDDCRRAAEAQGAPLAEVMAAARAAASTLP